MENPFRSEEAAFRFLLLTLAALGAIVLASIVGGVWPGVGVTLFLAAVAVGFYLRHGRPAAPPLRAPTRRSADGELRILVVANETVGGETLLDCIRQKAEGVREEVLVVAPALNSPLRHWASDEDGARAAAEERVRRSVARLEAAGVRVRGTVGDADPLQAIEDALRTFGADEVVISTHPEGRSHWLERGVVNAARARFAVPITHVVVDLASDREVVR
jgi:hypothetical protein